MLPAWVECQDPGSTVVLNGVDDTGAALAFLDEHTQGFQCCGVANDCSEMILARQLVPEPALTLLWVVGALAVALLGAWRRRARRLPRG